MRNRKWEIGWQYGGIPFKPRLKRLRPERRVRFRRLPAFRIRRLPIFTRPRAKNSTSRSRRIDFRSDVGRATRLRLPPTTARIVSRSRALFSMSQPRRHQSLPPTIELCLSGWTQPAHISVSRETNEKYK